MSYETKLTEEEKAKKIVYFKISPQSKKFEDLDRRLDWLVQSYMEKGAAIAGKKRLTSVGLCGFFEPVKIVGLTHISQREPFHNVYLNDYRIFLMEPICKDLGYTGKHIKYNTIAETVDAAINFFKENKYDAKQIRLRELINDI